jgi:hypothetical protein
LAIVSRFAKPMDARVGDLCTLVTKGAGSYSPGPTPLPPMCLALKGPVSDRDTLASLPPNDAFAEECTLLSASTLEA